MADFLGKVCYFTHICLQNLFALVNALVGVVFCGVDFMNFMVFMREFLKEPEKIGAFAESSGFLARCIAEQVQGYKDIVEFGPGTGKFTLELLRQLPADGRLICFETNRRFYEHLKRIDDSRLVVINDSALKCQDYVDNYRCIVSGLPLASFDREMREAVMDLSCTAETFIQFQYTPLLGGKIREYFDDVKVKFVARNFPPAFVYICK